MSERRRDDTLIRLAASDQFLDGLFFALGVAGVVQRIGGSGRLRGLTRRGETQLERERDDRSRSHDLLASDCLPHRHISRLVTGSDNFEESTGRNPARAHLGISRRQTG